MTVGLWRGGLLAAAMLAVACGDDGDSGSGPATNSVAAGGRKAAGGAASSTSDNGVGGSPGSTTGSDDTAGQASTDGANGGVAGASVEQQAGTTSAGGPPSGPRSCTNATECEQTRYYKPVNSEADCYCPVCPSDYGRQLPLNHATQALYKTQWTAVCVAEQVPGTCVPPPCPLLPAPVCVNGQCAQ
jgi:hypothetical protein